MSVFPVPPGHFSGGSNITTRRSNGLAALFNTVDGRITTLDEQVATLDERTAGVSESGTASETTTESLQVWVNATTGDDANDGLSEATPKLTLDAGLAVLPDTLRHHCTLNLRGVFNITPTTGVRVQKTLLGAILVIDGGPETEVLEGPFTSDGSSTTSIADSGQSWTTDEHVGLWVEILSGPATGQTRNIVANDGTTLYVDESFTNPGTGASFQISQPATKITSTSVRSLVLTCTPLNTYQNYPAVQRITLEGKTQIYHIGGALITCGVVSRSTYTPSLRSESPGAFAFFPYLTDPVTYAFSFVARHRSSFVGSGGAVHLRKLGGDFVNLGYMVNGGSVDFNRCSVAGSSSGSATSRVVDGSVTVRDSIVQDRLQISGASGVGLSIVDSNVDVTGLQVDSCGSHAVEVDGGKLVHSKGASTGSGSTGAGVYVHSQGVIHTKAGAAPTISGGAAGEVSLDGATQQSTWAAIEAGTPINGATVGNDEFVIVKRV